MNKLRKSVQGIECHMRLPGICNFDPETTVLCHIRRGVQAGTGRKPPDVCAVAACSDCHSAIDRRTAVGAITPDELDGYILEGHMRTLTWWWENGYIAARA